MALSSISLLILLGIQVKHSFINGVIASMLAEQLDQTLRSNKIDWKNKYKTIFLSKIEIQLKEQQLPKWTQTELLTFFRQECLDVFNHFSESVNQDLNILENANESINAMGELFENASKLYPSLTDSLSTLNLNAIIKSVLVDVQDDFLMALPADAAIKLLVKEIPVNREMLTMILQTIKDFRADWKEENTTSDKESALEQTEKILIESILLTYNSSSTFRFLKLPGDKDAHFGLIPMDEYYGQLSYIELKDLRNRQSLLKLELEFSSKKIEKHHYEISTDYLSEDVLKNNTRTIITGNPGVGKSTYARWLCRKWALNELKINTIPLYLPLRFFNWTTSDNVILDYILEAYSFESIEKQDLKDYWKYRPNTFLLLLDGYDELDINQQNQLFKDFSKLHLNDVPFVLLSRPYGLQNLAFDKDVVLQIDGFNESSIHQYLRKFIAFSETKDKSATELSSIIDDNPILTDSSYNPLLLSYMVLVYLTKPHPQELLSGISSTFALQEEVYQWLMDYALERPVAVNQSYQLEKSAMALAYEMQINRQFTYDSANKGNELKQVAEYLWSLGIGHFAKKEIGNHWRFTFSTVTFQEFLAARHLAKIITPAAFVYLLQDQHFNNLTKLIIGGLANDLATNQSKLEAIFDLIQQKAHKKGNLWRQIYLILLSETSPIYINKKVNNTLLKQLFDYYQKSYFDESWKSVIREALSKIYYKLNPSNLHKFKDIITQKVSLLRKANHQKRGGAQLVYTLYDFSQITDIGQYSPFVKELGSVILNLFDKINEIIATQLEIGEADNDNYEKISSLQNIELEVSNTAFIALQCLKKARTEDIKILADQLFEKRQSCPIDLRLDLEEILLRILSKKEILNDFNLAIQEVSTLEPSNHNHLRISEVLDSIVSKSIKENQENFEEETFEEDMMDLETLDIELPQQSNFHPFPNELLNLAISIFRLGHKNIYDLKLLQSSIDLLLDKILHPNIVSASNEIKHISDMVTDGLSRFSEKEVLPLLFEVSWKLENNELKDFASNEIFEEYVAEQFSYHQSSLNLQKLPFLITALKNTTNGRFSFFKYRPQIWNLLESWLHQHEDFFKNSNYEVAHSDEKQRTKPIQYIIDIPYYNFDKKYFIDQSIPLADRIAYISDYVLPYLFNNEFPFFQEKYWTFLKRLEHKEILPKLLVDVLLNGGIYRYSSNLKHLSEVLSKISQQLKNGDTEFTKYYAHPLLCIVSNTLCLLYLNPDNLFKKELIAAAKVILQNPDVKEIQSSTDYLETFDPKDMIAYLMLYYFTADEKYIFSFPYQTFKEQYPAEHQEFILLLINLFSTKYGSINKTNFDLLKKALPKSCAEDIRNYLKDYRILYFKFKKEQFSEKLNQ